MNHGRSEWGFSSSFVPKYLLGSSLNVDHFLGSGRACDLRLKQPFMSKDLKHLERRELPRRALLKLSSPLKRHVAKVK